MLVQVSHAFVHGTGSLGEENERAVAPALTWLPTQSTSFQTHHAKVLGSPPYLPLHACCCVFLQKVRCAPSCLLLWSKITPSKKSMSLLLWTHWHTEILISKTTQVRNHLWHTHVSRATTDWPLEGQKRILCQILIYTHNFLEFLPAWKNIGRSIYHTCFDPACTSY